MCLIRSRGSSGFRQALRNTATRIDEATTTTTTTALSNVSLKSLELMNPLGRCCDVHRIGLELLFGLSPMSPNCVLRNRCFQLSRKSSHTREAIGTKLSAAEGLSLTIPLIDDESTAGNDSITTMI